MQLSKIFRNIFHLNMANSFHRSLSPMKNRLWLQNSRGSLLSCIIAVCIHILPFSDRTNRPEHMSQKEGQSIPALEEYDHRISQKVVP